MSGKIETEELRLLVPWGFIAAKAWGSPQNSPVLVVHGIMDNAGSFNRLIPLLPNRFYYVCIDLPGHGLSSHFQAGVPLDFFNYVLSIELAVKALGWKDFIYLGHSLGGLVGSFYTSIYPGRVKKMIAIDLGLPIRYSGDKLVSRVQELQKDALENCNNPEKLYSYDDVIYALKYKRMYCLNTEAAEAMFERAVTKVGKSYKYNRDPRIRIDLRPLFYFEQYLDFFKKINIPLLFILTSVHTGILEIHAMKEGFDVLKKISSIEFVLVEGNHDAHNNNPERVAPVIQKFLDISIPSKL